MAKVRVRMSPLIRSHVLLTSALLCLALTSCRKKDQAGPGNVAGASGQKQPVEVVNISRRDLTESLSLVGSLAPN